MGRKRNTELTVIQSKAIALMVAGYSHRDISIKLNLTPDTISLWHRQEWFLEQKKKALDTIFNAAMAELIDGTQEAVRELRSMITDPDTPQRIKLGAISTLLNTVSRHKEQGQTAINTEIQGTSLDSKVDQALNLLIDSASTRNELQEAISLQQRQLVAKYQTSLKLTEDEYQENLKSISKLMNEFVPDDKREEFTERLKVLVSGNQP